jgi:PBP1b-binding outer membrane lipoprotein LpoB
MKKVFFAFVAASVVVLSACNNKPAESTETTTDTTAVTEAVTETAPVDSAAAATTDSAAAPAAQ